MELHVWGKTGQYVLITTHKTYASKEACFEEKNQVLI